MTTHVCHGCDSIWFGGWSLTTEHDACWRCRDRMTNVRPEIRAAMVVEEKMTGLMADLERERTRWEVYATGRIPDFCWACYVEFDRVTGHVCPPDRDTPHR